MQIDEKNQNRRDNQQNSRAHQAAHFTSAQNTHRLKFKFLGSTPKKTRILFTSEPKRLPKRSETRGVDRLGVKRAAEKRSE